ncbi:ATP synthase-coupling factor 6, mitochondrial isoform X2 [Anabas testudineus]|uniref:ATP synthase-coupling factor 6, mitochondrial isoform X2 n=1 Tax=Anabas testudineus TaxID=64144 RepID=UPI000E45B5B1|nr:ATP synthase-coupling factor 6, mitochondrial isoform X2 [Anabas testudineus]
MAVALFRKGLCAKCLYRDLCRCPLRDQAALLSSKSDRKEPRRTHIRKVKPQPAVDVAKLLEQLFSQKRPDAASLASASSTLNEVLLGQEVEETGAQSEALGNEEGLDLAQKLFLEKIREYNNLQRLTGGPAEADPGYRRSWSEETVKLQKLYGGGDLSSFPQFTFTEPNMDQDSK